MFFSSRGVYLISCHSLFLFLCDFFMSLCCFTVTDMALCCNAAAETVIVYPLRKAYATPVIPANAI